MTKKSKIVFFGNEKLATGISDVEPVISNSLVEHGYEIEKFITGPINTLGHHESNIAVLVAYGYIIPDSVLRQFPLGIINLHPSLLPLYRGPTPIEQAILDGAEKTGVSIMRLSSGMDEGPIYKQKSLALEGNETKSELVKKLQNLGSDLLIEVIDKITGDGLKPRSQPHPDRATYTQKLTKSDGDINWEKSATQIEREIRAYAGWPKSRTKLRDIECIISKASVVNLNGEAGDYSTKDNDLIIFCGENALKIERIQPIGKRDMTTEEFLRGYSAKI